MKTKFLFVCLVFFSFITTPPPYNIGDKVSNFSLTNANDDASVSLNDLADRKGVALIFTSNDCPFARFYEKRILQIQQEFKDKGIAVLLINSNNPETSTGDSKAMMKKKAYPFPYLIDSRQTLANQFAAEKTPEVFVLKNINGNFVLQYKGAIDNNPQNESDVSRYYLKDALNAIVANTSIKASEMRATGCMIQR
ncbi:MAG: thioredoxin family protein [Cytophagaceae bacterium]|jgi:peroxiredoxin